MTSNPAYRVIYEEISGRVGRGEYPVGSTLPRELDLAMAFGVSRNTVRGALALLEDDGLIRRVRNAGTTVVATSRSTKIDFSFATTSGIRNLAEATRFAVLERGERKLPKIPRLRGIRDANGPWAFVRGIRLANSDGSPVGLNEIYIRRELDGVLDDVDIRRQLVWPRFGLLLGKPVTTMQISLNAIVLDGSAAGVLRARPGDAAMHLLEILRSDDGEVNEVIESVYLTRNFSFETEIKVF